MKFLLSLAVLSSLAASAVHAHSVITEISGASGGTGQAFAVRDDVSRTESIRAAQVDASIIRDREINRGQVQACGMTNAVGPIDISAAIAAAEAVGPLPTIGADGQITMTVHQGAGPFDVDVSPDDGQTFEPADVTTQVPGRFSLSGATAEDFPLVATMPEGMVCAGGASGNECIVRARNGAIAGPFGGCGLVAQEAA